MNLEFMDSLQTLLFFKLSLPKCAAILQKSVYCLQDYGYIKSKIIVYRETRSKSHTHSSCKDKRI